MPHATKSDDTAEEPEWIISSANLHAEPTPKPTKYKLACETCGRLDPEFEKSLPALNAASDHFCRFGPEHVTGIVPIYEAIREVED